jgi:hypothetical protein
MPVASVFVAGFSYGQRPTPLEPLPANMSFQLRPAASATPHTEDLALPPCSVDEEELTQRCRWQLRLHLITPSATPPILFVSAAYATADDEDDKEELAPDAHCHQDRCRGCPRGCSWLTVAWMM